MEEETGDVNDRYGSILSQERHDLLGALDLKTDEGHSNSVPALKSYIVNPCASIPISGYDYKFDDESEDENEDNNEDFQSEAEEPSSGSNQGFVATGDKLGAWPQRLLRVDNMTSYEWQPGNIYGGQVAPKYNAISYTWGRYDIDSAFIEHKANKRVMRNTKAIHINEVRWAIPRIDPQHFTDDEFRAVIKQSCVLGGAGKTDFVWVDVACIDQRNGPQKDMEIGRQAKIFGGAQRVFIWLTRLSENALCGILTELAESSRKATKHVNEMSGSTQREPTNEQVDWILRSRTALDNLFIDPWFTSLWTLQEAFLCPHAYLLGRKATQFFHFPAPIPGKLIPADLSNLFRICDNLRRVSENNLINGQTYCESPPPPKIITRRKFLNEVNTMIKQRGLSALATNNPIALYGIAFSRRTSRDEDRVYGIEQVFGLRLGVSASRAKKSYNRFELEAQLGSRILKKFPVLSQLHVYTEPVEPLRGWRVSSSSRIPDLDVNSSISAIKFQTACALGIKSIQGMGVGTFKGRLCTFESLRVAWEQVADPPSCGPWNQGDQSPHQICLDVFLNHKKPEFRHISSDKLDASGFEEPYPAVWGFARDIARGKEQFSLASWMGSRLKELFPGKALKVLLLGSFKDTPNDEKDGNLFNAGLVILESESNGLQYWKRLGFCIWECGHDRADSTDAARDVLHAKQNNPSWKDSRGIFG
ncbi:hypothetical protein BP6252_11618 [Coleophoma cylindrospora]|uniref:Heterokaryon incompatibility domain-containing protein n=1 Tax=Coleophoma cylindrospora TaxID=1849047 RepID=A0A3D8QK47_9HELO|nr:hypothetical protein BP6252_11618 [Coleophoma cylindrospora]